MAELKPGWKRVRFGDVVRLNKETCKDPEAEGIERVIGLEHLDPGDLRVRSWADVADGTTFSNRVRPGQVLFGKRRAYQRKLAVADFDAICSGDIYVFETADQTQLLQELLPYICQADSFFGYAVNTSAGSLSPRTSWKSLVKYEFDLPPLEEQRRIAVACDAFKQCEDILIDTSESSSAVARSATLAMLAIDAGMPGRSLVAKINPPKSWKVTTIGALANKGEQAVQVGPFGGSLSSRHYTPAGIEVLKVHNIGHDGFIDRSKFVHVANRHAVGLARYKVLPDDVLVVAQGDTTGRVAIVRECDEGALISQHLIRVRLDLESISASWLCAFMRSPLFAEQASRVMKKSTRPGLNTSDILEMLIPLPPRSEQEDRAADIASVMRMPAQFRARRGQLLQDRLAFLSYTLANGTC